jgi:hypothetical protein
VTSERQLAANRRNAVRGTGPRTRAGKERSRGNALQHGLSANLAVYRRASSETEDLARLIAGDRPHASARIYAREAASAELDLLAVRAVRAKLVESLAANSSEEAAKAILNLDRYERRAFAKRNRAFGLIDATRPAEDM